MKSSLVLPIVLLCVHATLGRGVETNEYYGDSVGYNRDDIEYNEDTNEYNGNIEHEDFSYDDDDKFYDENDDMIENVTENDLTEEKPSDRIEDESENHKGKVSSLSAVSNDEAKKAYKRYLKKLERVKSQADFDRIFKTKNKFSVKRQSFTYAEDTPCNPKDATEPVRFTPNSSTEVIYPQCIPVKRCGGCCSEGKKCTATSTQKKQTYVRLFDVLTQQLSPYLVNYVDDTVCSCQCIQKASECKSTQVFDSHNCRCKCNIPQQKCGINKQWSSFECKCVCSNQNPKCPAGYQWNKDTCQCEKVYYPTCTSGKSLNKTMCICN